MLDWRVWYCPWCPPCPGQNASMIRIRFNMDGLDIDGQKDVHKLMCSLCYPNSRSWRGNVPPTNGQGCSLGRWLKITFGCTVLVQVIKKFHTISATFTLQLSPISKRVKFLQHTRRYVSYCTSVLNRPSIYHNLSIYLSTIYRPSVDQNVDKYRPTIDQLSTKCRPPNFSADITGDVMDALFHFLLN